MTQSAYAGVIPNGSGASVRGNINLVDQAILSQNSGNSAPNPTYPFMQWRDTDDDILYRRNSTNTGWEIVENYGATTNPTVNNDITEGYIAGSTWINTSIHIIWVCLNNADGVAVWRPINNDVLSVKQFGAKGDGSTDDTAAILLAIANMTPGGKLYFPTGTYKVSSEIELDVHGIYFGDYIGTIIKTTHASDHIFNVSSGAVTIRDMSFDSFTTRTGGAFIYSNQSVFRLQNFFMQNFYYGVHLADVTALRNIETGYFLDGVANYGIGIYCEGGFDVSIKDILLNGSSNIAHGILLTSMGDIVLEDLNLIHCNSALTLYAGAGDVIASVWADNCFFDTSGIGVTILADGSGANVVRSRFSNCWFSSASNVGCALSVNAGGIVDGVEFDSCHVLLNTHNGIQASGCKNIKINGGEFANNGDSAIAMLGTTHFIITAARIGDTAGLAANDYGIFIDSSCDYYIVTNNDLTGNTTSNISDAGLTHKVVDNNLT